MCIGIQLERVINKWFQLVFSFTWFDQELFLIPFMFVLSLERNIMSNENERVDVKCLVQDLQNNSQVIIVVSI